MHFSTLSLLSLFAASVSAALPTSVTLAYTPLSSAAKSPTPKPFATLSYHANNKTYTLHSFTTPKLTSKLDSLVRIGIVPQSRSQQQIDGFAVPSTTVAEQSVLSVLETAVIRIVLDAEYGVISAGLSRDWESRDGKDRTPRLDVVNSVMGPKPVLNRPVVLGEDGKMPAQEKPEPTLLQRYWWIGALLLLFTFMGGGGGEEGGK